MLTDEQLIRLLTALKKMLQAYNWSLVLQIEVPERIQYATIRDMFNQTAKYCGGTILFSGVATISRPSVTYYVAFFGTFH